MSGDFDDEDRARVSSDNVSMLLQDISPGSCRISEQLDES